MAIQRNTAIAIVLAIAVVIIFIMLGFFGISGFGSSDESALGGPQNILNELSATGAVASLETYDIVTGTGPAAKAGDTLVVHYTGVLPDGTVFDSSLDRGQPFSFVLGSGQVIQGWEEGMTGMQKGGRRLLAIPPSLGYGPNAVGAIPANSTLIFEVELLDINPTGE